MTSCGDLADLSNDSLSVYVLNATLHSPSTNVSNATLHSPSTNLSNAALHSPSTSTDRLNIVVVVFNSFFALFILLLYYFYSKVTSIDCCFPPRSVKAVFQSEQIAGVIVSLHCILRAILTVIIPVGSSHLHPQDLPPGTLAPSFFTVLSLFCVILDSICITGFVAGTISSCILTAECFRVSILSYLSTLKSRLLHQEHHHHRSIRDAIILSWLLGLFIAVAFVAVAILQSAVLSDHRSFQLISCNLVLTAPNPIFYSAIGLYVLYECSSCLTFFIVYQWNDRRGWKYSITVLNRARADLRERACMISYRHLWVWIRPALLVSKLITATIVFMMAVIKYRDCDSKVFFNMCTFAALLRFTVPILILVHRSQPLRASSLLITRQMIDRCRSLIVWRRSPMRNNERESDMEKDQNREL